MTKSYLVQVCRTIVAALVAGIVFLAICGWLYDRAYVEKMLTRLAMPIGLIWLSMLLLSLTSFAVGRRRWATLLMFVCLFYWTAGSTYTASRFIRLLEGRYEPVDPKTAPEFDLVVVLGGSTFWDTDGNVWLSAHGDRLMLASRLYHQHRIKRLVTTGRLYDWYADKGVNMSEATERIWTEAGIPIEKITQVGGMNTSQEMQSLRKYLADDPPERIGLLTSAFHLPRAERLAKRNGLKFEPIPSGFMGVDEPLPLGWVPCAYGFQMSELAAKEFLASVIGR